MEMNRLTLKTLAMSIITEMKFGEPLHRTAGGAKAAFKKMVGLAPNASNKHTLTQLNRVYIENGVGDDFQSMLTKFGAEYMVDKVYLEMYAHKIDELMEQDSKTDYSEGYNGNDEAID